jgi:hypothetical protein
VLHVQRLIQIQHLTAQRLVGVCGSFLQGTYKLQGQHLFLLIYFSLKFNAALVCFLALYKRIGVLAVGMQPHDKFVTELHLLSMADVIMSTRSGRSI